MPQNAIFWNSTAALPFFNKEFIFFFQASPYFLTNFFCFWSSWLKLSLNLREFNLNVNQLLNSVIWTKWLIFHAHLRLHKLVWGCKAPYKSWFRNHLGPRTLFGVWNEYSQKMCCCAQNKIQLSWVFIIAFWSWIQQQHKSAWTQ